MSESRSETIEEEGAVTLDLVDWANPLGAVVSLAEKHPGDARAVYRDLLRDVPECLSFSRRPIKTIALYYRRIRSGGAERVVAELCGRLSVLKKSGSPKYRVILITDEPASEDDYPVPECVVRVQIPSYGSGIQESYEPRARALWDVVERYSIDAFVDSMWNSRALPWDLLCVKSHPSHPAFVVHCHGSAAMLYKFDYRPEDTFGPNALADSVVCLSSGDEWYWSQANGHTCIIANPIVGNIDESVRAKEGFTLLWVGRISREKHPEEALRVFRRVHDSNSRARLLFVGGVDNPNLEREMREYIAVHRLENSVSFEGYTPDVAPYFQKANVLLVTSEFEGFCLVLYEAAARGLPIVMYDMPYLMFCEQLEGWSSVSQKDADAAAACVLEVLEDAGVWAARSQKLFETAARFMSKDPVNEWDKLFDGLAENASTRPPSPGAYWTLCHIARFHSECSSDLLRQCNLKEERIQKMRHSHSFRVGKAITAPLRSLRKIAGK